MLSDLMARIGFAKTWIRISCNDLTRWKSSVQGCPRVVLVQLFCETPVIADTLVRSAIS